MPVMSTFTSSRLATGGLQTAKPGQIVFTLPGFGGDTSGTWIVPRGVYRISGVLISGGAGGNAAASASIGGDGGFGGHMLWFNDLPVSPGETILVQVSTGGAGGVQGVQGQPGFVDGHGGTPGDTYVRRGTVDGPGVVIFAQFGNGGGGASNRAGEATLREFFNVQNLQVRTTTTTAFGAGGSGGPGFSGTYQSPDSAIHVGGDGGTGGSVNATAGQNGGGGGGAGGSGSFTIGAGGGGTGFITQGTGGTAGTNTGAFETLRIGGPGTGGGQSPYTASGSTTNGTGGFPGGGGGGGSTTRINGQPGGPGVVRIIWGAGRSYPSTNTQDVIFAVPDAFDIGTGFNDAVSSIALQSDGKILVGGFFSSYNGESQSRITRLNTDGTRDTGFAIGTGFFGIGSTVNAIVVQPDGKILVGGSFTRYQGATTRRYITRLEANGSSATSLGTGTNASVLSIALQSDGKILLGGDFIAYSDEILTGPYFTRLNANGTRDTGFNTGSGPNVNSIYTIIVQPDGKILVGGMFNQFNGVTAPAIIRLNADGTRDTEFTLLSSAFPNNIRAMALQPDGKILLVGEFVDFNGVTQNRITRFNSDGTRDTGFTSGTGFERTVYTITLQSDGKILVGGNFRSYNGVTQNRITRLNTDGTRDTGFTTGTGFSGDVNAIVVLPNGNILVGGSFSSYNGTSRSNIARLTSSGLIS